MRARTHGPRPPTSPHGLAWLFWLALLLPLAQSAAAWHGYTHVERAEAGHADGHPPQAGHCDLCLSAAAVTGGALPGGAFATSALATPHDRPGDSADGVWQAPPTPAYLSRAPPAAAR